MSIDARIAKVVIFPDSSGYLELEDRLAKDVNHLELHKSIVLQKRLYWAYLPGCASAPKDRMDGMATCNIWNLFRQLEGKDIWGSSETILLGQTPIARRKGCTSIEWDGIKVQEVVNSFNSHIKHHIYKKAINEPS